MTSPLPSTDPPRPSGDPAPLLSERDLLGDLIDAIDAVLIVCDGDGNVQVANAAAIRELGRARTLCLRHGMLHTRVDGSALEAAIAAASRRGVRQVVSLRDAEERTYAVVSPLASPNGPQRVLVMTGRREPSSQLSLELLGIHEGLTPSERSVLMELASRRSPARIAHDREVSLATVRTQIGSVHAKLGVRSRHELLCLVSSVPPLAFARCQDGPHDHMAWAPA